MKHLKPPIKLQDPENQSSFEFVQNLDMADIEHYDFPDNFYDHVKRLWHDPGMQGCYKRSNEFPLIDCAK